jgi:DNA-binding NarL/FixJ family response regulator
MFKQGSQTRVLIVDDVADVRQDLRVLLEVVGGFQVVGEASNGREAIEQACALRPDVVIMDLAMPVLDGYTAATRIKTDLAGCRIAALTVHCAEFERLQAYAAGFDAFVVKGAPLLELLGAIRPLADETNPESDRS